MRAVLLLLSTLLPVSATALEARFEAAPAPVVFRHHRQLFEGHGFDTGWHPTSGPIQVRFIGAVGAEVSAVAPGTVHLGWGLQPALWAQGDPLAGQLSMDLGAEFRGLLRLDLALPTGQHLRWEGTLPSVFSLDFRFADSQRFTPFLVAGQDPSSVQIADAIRDTELLSIPLTEAFLPIPGVGGFFDVTGSGSLEATLRDGALVFPEGTLDRVDAPLGWAVPTEPTFRSSAAYRAAVDTQGTLELEPRVSVKVGPLVWKLAGLPIPIPLPTRHEEWDFAAQTVAFELPRLALVALDGTATDTDTRTGTLQFDARDLSQRSEKAVTIANLGRAPLEGLLRVEGEGFAAISTEPFTLPPGARTTVPIGFAPPGPGTFQGFAHFESSDPAGTLTVALAGTAQAPGAEAPPSAAAELPVGTDAEGAESVALPPSGCGVAGTPTPLAVLALLGLALQHRRSRL